MPDHVGLFLQDDFSLQQSLDYVKYAEARGFESVWQSEVRLVRDCVVPMAAYAATTMRIRIGSGVMNIWTRNPATIASEMLGLDDLAQDRIMCGLGSWYDPLAASVGINRNKHLLAMREVLTTTRKLLNMERVTYRGEFVTLRDISLDIQSGRTEPRRIPLYIGAIGPKMIALAGEIADGILLNYLVSPQYNEMALNQLDIGAQKGGRSIHSIERPQLIVCSVNTDRSKAINAARKLVTQYIVQQPQLMRANGVPQSLIDDLSQVVSNPADKSQISYAQRLVSDDIVQLVTASGTPEEARAKVREYIQAGATAAILYPLGQDVRSMIDAFANGYSRV